MKKILSLLLVLVLGAAALTPPAYAGSFSSLFEMEEGGLAAQAAYLYSVDTGVVLYEKNADTPLSAASLTKLITCILLVEQTPDLDARDFTAEPKLFDYVYGKGGSTADIKRGAVLSGRDLLYAMLLPSANEAAYIAANKLGNGSIENFVYVMNAKAKQLGCVNTTFVDPCGLELGNVTTAYDMAQVIGYVMKNDILAQMCKTTQYEMPAGVGYSSSDAYTVRSTNMLVYEGTGDHFYREYAQGGKTGSLEEWQNYAGWHTKNGMTYISVVMNSPNSCDEYKTTYGYGKYHPALYETCKLMDWAFDGFKLDTAIDVGAFVTEIKVKYATEADTLKLYPKNPLYTIMPINSDSSATKKTYDLPETVAAPVEKGDVIGTVTLFLMDEPVGTVDLIAGSSIQRNSLLYTLAKVGEFFSSLYFKVVLVLAGICLALYFVWFLHAGYKRRKSNQVRRRR